MFKRAVLGGVFVNVEETVTLKETKLQDVNKLSVWISDGDACWANQVGESGDKSNKAIFSEPWLHLLSKLRQHIQHATSYYTKGICQ